MPSQNRLEIEETSLRFSEIVIPDIMRTSISTGWTTFDKMCNGRGIKPSTVGIITGEPGTGKSTTMLQLAASLALQGHIVSYNSGEESTVQLALKAETMGISEALRQTLSWASNFSEIGQILNHAENLRLANPGKHVILINDSLQTLEKAPEPGTRGRPLSDAAQHLAAIWDTTRWCKENYTCAFMVSQSTKEGDMAGSQKIKHVIDFLLKLEECTERGNVNRGKKVAKVEKNRFPNTDGESLRECAYSITRAGIIFEEDNSILPSEVAEVPHIESDERSLSGWTPASESPITTPVHINADGPGWLSR